VLLTTRYVGSDIHRFTLIQDTAVNLVLADGVVLRQGSYLSAVADIGVFEHSLTTDLLNHLVFVQKVFMKVSCWFDDNECGGGGGVTVLLFNLPDCGYS
jgi:hypothetical protein